MTAFRPPAISSDCSKTVTCLQVQSSLVLAINKAWHKKRLENSSNPSIIASHLASIKRSINYKISIYSDIALSVDGLYLVKVKISASALDALGVQCDSINHVSRYRVL